MRDTKQTTNKNITYIVIFTIIIIVAALLISFISKLNNKILDMNGPHFLYLLNITHFIKIAIPVKNLFTVVVYCFLRQAAHFAAKNIFGASISE